MLTSHGSDNDGGENAAHIIRHVRFLPRRCILGCSAEDIASRDIEAKRPTRGQILPSRRAYELRHTLMRAVMYCFRRF